MDGKGRQGQTQGQQFVQHDSTGRRKVGQKRLKFKRPFRCKANKTGTLKQKLRNCLALASISSASGRVFLDAWQFAPAHNKEKRRNRFAQQLKTRFAAFRVGMCPAQTAIPAGIKKAPETGA